MSNDTDTLIAIRTLKAEAWRAYNSADDATHDALMRVISRLRRDGNMEA
jgi:hypothetical protein